MNRKRTISIKKYLTEYLTSVIFDSDMFPVYNLIMVAENMVESGNVLRADPGLFDWGVVTSRPIHAHPSPCSFTCLYKHELAHEQENACTRTQTHKNLAI